MKKKVVLFHGTASTFGKKINIAPLALLHISSFLVKEGFEVKIISESLNKDYLRQTVSECEDAVCLGITAMTGNQIVEGLEISKLVKERFTHLPVVWGGWHPSILPDSTLSDPYVDMLITGQGQRSFFELSKALYHGDTKNFEKINGLGYKKEGRLILNNSALIESLDNFPATPYHLIDVEKTLIKTEYGDRTLGYVSSYGCPYRCSFCIEPIVNNRRWVSLSADRVVDEWEYLSKKYPLDSIAIYDSNFFVDKKRVIDICEGMLRRNLKINWGSANGRIPQLVKYEKEVWGLMEKAGLKMILTGSESGDQDVLDFINKDAKLDEVYEFTRLCRDYHIRILFSYMSGMPWSSDPNFNKDRVDKELKSILTQIDQLLDISKKNRFMIYAYTPLPGSKMYERALECGFDEPKSLKGWENIVYSPEDIFKQNTKGARGWLTKRQFQLITMLEQYVFGFMDLDAREWIAKGIGNGFIRKVFTVCYNFGYFLARLRLKFKFFWFPLDYWFFVKLRKRSRI
jgi:radical SAM superfamily enzyme YgiQ (UPF0313 family)